MTIDTQGLRQLAKVLCIRTAVNGEMIEIQEAADQIDALRAELEESSRALTLAGKTNKGLMDQIQRDSKELRRLCADRDKWRAQAKHETLAGKAAAEEVERLREALRFYANESNWRSMSVMERGPLVDEDGGEKARAALQGESHG